VPQENLVNFFKYYADKPQQAEAVQMLQQSMPDSLLKADSAWIVKYREEPPKPDVESPLPVKYFWQQDNGPQGWRQCQTSSIAMCLNYLGVAGINDDVDYLRVVNQFGDTTLQSSHSQALNHLGVRNRFRTDGSKETLIERVQAGFPTPIGVLHHGPVNNCSGGGHYLTVVGISECGNYTICHDPYGELDLVMGTWAKTGEQDGKFVHYSFKNLMPRWDLNNNRVDGWYWEIG